jgi:hypothetical protein
MIPITAAGEERLPLKCTNPSPRPETAATACEPRFSHRLCAIGGTFPAPSRSVGSGGRRESLPVQHHLGRPPWPAQHHPGANGAAPPHLRRGAAKNSPPDAEPVLSLPKEGAARSRRGWLLRAAARIVYYEPSSIDFRSRRPGAANRGSTLQFMFLSEARSARPTTHTGRVVRRSAARHIVDTFRGHRCPAMSQTRAATGA